MTTAKRKEQSLLARSGSWGSLRAAFVLVFALSTVNPGYSLTPNLVKKSWALVGPFGIQAPKAWTLLKGTCSGVTVAVIDTGVDFSYADLKDSQWVNKKEEAGKPGIDDDSNGFVDDVYGYDFVTKTGKTIVDEHSHGTHIAGIIAANSPNENGIRGVCPGAKIMSLRYHGPSVSGTQALNFTIKAIHYAITNGAQVINYSGGGRYYSADEYAAMKAAEAAGVLVVAAAGNEASDVDKEENRYYPASYGLSNIISVAAIDSTGNKVRSSNWGAKSVDIAAPGKDILSTGKNGTYQMLTGTSQATAFVSGAAALVLAANPKLSYDKVKEAVIASGRKSSVLNGVVRNAATLDAYAVVQFVQKKGAVKPASKLARKKGPTADPSLARSTATWQSPSSKKRTTQIHPALNQ